MESTGTITLSALPGLPEIQSGDPLADMIIEALKTSVIEPKAGDILVLAHKVVSKSEGQVVHLSDIEPSPEAIDLARQVR